MSRTHVRLIFAAVCMTEMTRQSAAGRTAGGPNAGPCRNARFPNARSVHQDFTKVGKDLHRKANTP